MTDPATAQNPPDQSDRHESAKPQSPDEPEWARSKWIVGLMLIALGQYLVYQDTEGQLAWLVLGPVGLGLALSGLTDYIHVARLQPGKMRLFKVGALALAGCGFLIGLYVTFRPRPDYFPYLPSGGSSLADPFLGVAAVLIVMGLTVWQIARDGRTKSSLALRKAVIIGLCLGAVWYGTIFPHFRSIQARNMQNEARTNLGGIFVAEREFYKEHGRYGNFDEIGFKPHEAWPYIRYTFRIDRAGRPGTILATKKGTPPPDNSIVPAGISPDGQGFTATATANIDRDETVDQWHVNDMKEGLQTADVNDVNDRTVSQNH